MRGGESRLVFLMIKFSSIFVALFSHKLVNKMGKGDKKTRKGKIKMGTYGVSRPKNSGSEKVADKPKKADKK